MENIIVYIFGSKILDGYIYFFINQVDLAYFINKHLCLHWGCNGATGPRFGMCQGFWASETERFLLSLYLRKKTIYFAYRQIQLSIQKNGSQFWRSND